ncbi:MAG TPA: hypothetical protein VFZ49_11250 [Pyrinomonadaceae bacterium]
MTKLFLRTTALLTFLAFIAPASVSAQFTIKIPKIPKIVKEKPQTASETSNAGDGSPYDKETFQSIYNDTGHDEFGGYSRYVSPYLNCYGKKHNISQDTIDMWPKMHGGDSDQDLALGQQRLAELETKLKSRMRSFPHTGKFAGENPGLVYDVAVNRAAYLQCLRDGQIAEKEAAETARSDNMSSFFLEEIAATRKEVAEYTPAGKIYLVGSRNDATRWLNRAMVPVYRKEFFDQWKFPAATVAKFNAELDALASEAPPKIAAFTASQTGKIRLRSAVDERMMLSAMTDVPGVIVHKTGMYDATWTIQKNDYGIPTYRWKTGAIYGRNPKSTHPYCWIWLISIRQDYSGGGTYGSSYPKHINVDIATCPAK